MFAASATYGSERKMSAQKRERAKNYIGLLSEENEEPRLGLLSEENEEPRAADAPSVTERRIKAYVLCLMAAMLHRRSEAR